MLGKSIGLLLFSLLFVVVFTSAFALTELERATISDPRLVNAFGAPLFDNVNVNQQVQITADITNKQDKSQNFVYLVQIKDENGFVVSLGWISGQLTPSQKLSPSLSWMPRDEGEFTAEIFVWNALKNHSALVEYAVLKINVS